jgi:glycosyltransferase involved in cell wall biosynthesis
LRICLFILNIFEFDSRARLICHDILSNGWDLEIIAAVGGEMDNFEGAAVHKITQSSWPIRQRRFIEYNIRAMQIASKIDADIYHAVDLDTLWAAVNSAKYRKAKVLYEARELYTELMALHGRPLVKAFWKTVERHYIQKANAVVTINQSIASELAQRYNIEAPQVVVNAAESRPIENRMNLREKYDLNCEFVLIYQGILRPGQGIARALQAVNSLPEVGIVFIGDGPYRGEIEKHAARLGISSRMKITGMIAPDRLPEYTAGGDAGLLLMEPVALNNRLALPQKLFQYIEAGVPPIVTDLPEMKKIVEGDALGLVLPASSQETDGAIIKEFLYGRLETAKAACESIKGKYGWNSEGRKMLEIYRGLV